MLGNFHALHVPAVEGCLPDNSLSQDMQWMAYIYSVLLGDDWALFPDL